MTTPPTPAGAALDALSTRWADHWPDDLKARLCELAEAYTAARRAYRAYRPYRHQPGATATQHYAEVRDANALYGVLLRAIKPALRQALGVQRLQTYHLTHYCEIDLDAQPPAPVGTEG